MRNWMISAVVAAAVSGMAPIHGQEQELAPAPPPVRKLELKFDRGNVTLIAQNVSVPEILAEWTRLGGCQFVNAEKLARTPVQLQFENYPEAQVLDSLLRSAAGIIVAPRTTRTSGASSFELVQILPTSNPTTNAFTTSSPVSAPIRATSPDDEIPPVTPGVNPAAPPRAEEPDSKRPPAPTSVGVPGSGVFVPIQPINSGQPAGRGGGPATPPVTTTGRGGGGGQ